jgi:endonuclease YncB( thermonuclease family)
VTWHRYNPLVGSMIKIHDGDTAWIDIVQPQIERYTIVQSRPDDGNDLRTRFARINADELGTPTGDAAFAALAEFVGVLPVTVYLFSTLPTRYKPDKYGGRIDAEVVLEDGTNLSDWMLANGLARPMRARRRPRTVS